MPTAIDSDVNAALAGERRWGAASDVSNAVYLTVGTGIGGGAMANGEIVHGMLHTEMGHMHVPRIPEDAGFAGGVPEPRRLPGGTGFGAVDGEALVGTGGGASGRPPRRGTWRHATLRTA